MVRFGSKTAQVSNGHAAENGAHGTALVTAHEWDPSARWRADRDLVHDPVRLQIVAMVLRDGGATFQDVRTKLALTDTEVAAQTKRLEAAGLLESTKSVGGTGMIVSFGVTAKGQQVMEGYCDWMRDILQGLPGSTA